MMARGFQIGVLGIAAIAFLLLGRNIESIMQTQHVPARPAHSSEKVIKKQGKTDAKTMARISHRGE